MFVIIAAAYRLYGSIIFLTRTDEIYGVAGIMLGTEAEVVCAHVPESFQDAKNLFQFARRFTYAIYTCPLEI